MNLNNFIFYYLIFINVLAFSLYGIDKGKAKAGKWRISERTLMIVAIIGGSIGALLGMRIFRHKTKHWKFKLGLPLILILQILLVCACFFHIK